jgi:hypothetical protein
MSVRMSDKPKDLDAFAESIKAGEPLQTAMLKGNYSPNVARKGRAGLTGPMLEKLADHRIKLARRFKPDERAEIVRGALIDNVLTGKDVATKSIELMGKDKEVAIFQADTQIGIVLAMPKQAPATIECKVLPELED